MLTLALVHMGALHAVSPLLPPNPSPRLWTDGSGACPYSLSLVVPPPSCGCSGLVCRGSDKGVAEDTGGCHVQTEGTSGTEEGTH